MASLQARFWILALAMAAATSAVAAPPTGAPSQSATDKAEEFVKQPLRDTNIDKKDIPPLLERASAAPYDRKDVRSCAQIGASIAELDTVLGPDVDVPPSDKRDDASTAVGLTTGLIGSLIPGRGLVRHLTGADKAEAAYIRALYAGIARRAFLKGTASAKGCKPADAAP